MIRTSTAVWRGNGPQGKGALTTQSGVFQDQPYSFQTRFASEDGKAGTNPEELLGAAHAGCFAMALAFALTEAGKPADELRVAAKLDFVKLEAGWTIRNIALELEGKVPGLDAAKFNELAEKAKKNCPISRALAATPITLAVKFG
ncbi:MAG: OsmC family protein [Planctomycetes bacterium]|nr:OsmC family protein [Planctomycetota bacterium]